jgi:flagellar hook protein FlgE
MNAAARTNQPDVPEAGRRQLDVAPTLNPAEGTRRRIDRAFDSIRTVCGSFQHRRSRILVLFTGSAAPQTIDMTFGSRRRVQRHDRTRHGASLAASNDGYPPAAGRRADSRQGILEGVTSNGYTFPLAQLSIASFLNPDGLSAHGDNYFVPTLASGEVEVGAALSGSRGAVRGSQLEQSNVDIALEFTRLIVAQRGFSANARTIRVTDEVLEELTNLIR